MEATKNHERGSAASVVEDGWDDRDEYDCSWCCGEGSFFGSEIPGYDPGWHLPDEQYPCPACKGSGNRKDQVLF